MSTRSMHDGREDGLEPLESLDLSRVESVADLVRGMSKTAFSGRELGRALDVLVEMTRDSGCHVVLTVSGAMTVAKQGQIICDLIDRGIVDTLVATGALIAHGLTESMGRVHYRYEPEKSDEELFQQGYNRIYDTLEMEANLNDVEALVRSVLTDGEPEGGVWSSSRLCRAVGGRLSADDQGPGILKSAFQRDVPVFIPAFTDSEIGLDTAIWAIARGLADQERDAAGELSPKDLFRSVPPFNPFLDLEEYALRAGTAPRLGIVTIGGGVPRNWAQQISPYFDVVNHRLGTNFNAPRFQYGVRICPEPVHWGGLSGCTYSEGVSWGKFVPPSEGGRFAEVPADATIALPFLARALFEVLDADAD